MICWLNVITHNYNYLFKPDLSSSLKSLRRTIDAKLEQVANMELLVKVYMVVVWHTLSKWREITIACSLYYMCLNVTNKESEWLIHASSLLKILRAYYNYNSPLLYSMYFSYVLRWQINVATLIICSRKKWNNLSLWDIY